ncbi:MAG: beta galactosidase jelly roll domain-containing protein [Phycisphaeraceae bacterium]|nr:beta galactosidase jelly roll domain-containing protein [Phycisphaeraceae bacterium]
MKLSEESPVELMSFRTPLWEVRQGDVTHPTRATWTFAHRRKTPILVTIGSFVGRGLVLLNNKPIHYLDRPGPDRLVLVSEMLSRSNNTLQIALATDSIGPEGAEAMLNSLASSVQIVEGTRCISEKAEWSFAAWEPPPSHAYSDQYKGGRRGPVWWRTSFRASDDRPLLLDLTGMTKGQIFLNGRNVSRYWVATATGKSVPPQTRYLLPGPWLKPGAENVLLLFDEHGGNPARTGLYHAG